MILAAVAALNKAMLPCLSLQNQFDPVQLFQPYYSISPRVSHYFWNVIAIACSYISNLGLEPACHVVWNNAFSFFIAKKKVEFFGSVFFCTSFYVFHISVRRQVDGIYGGDTRDVGPALPLPRVQRPWRNPLWSGWRVPLERSLVGFYVMKKHVITMENHNF